MSDLLDKVYELRGIYNNLKTQGFKMNISFLNSYYTNLIYNNLRIEGNALTIVDVSDSLEHNTTVRGKSLTDYAEVCGMRDAVNMLKIHLNKELAINSKFIRFVHDLVTRGSLSYEKCGVYRINPVFLSTTAYIPPESNLVPVLMEELIGWYNYRNAQGFDFIETIIIFHQRLEHIHPFIDGNGRTGRMVLNYMLLQLDLVPIIILTDDRQSYFDALEQANWDETSTDAIVSFILERIVESLEQHIQGMDNSEC